LASILSGSRSTNGRPTRVPALARPCGAQAQDARVHRVGLGHGLAALLAGEHAGLFQYLAEVGERERLARVDGSLRHRSNDDRTT
jgi:hypothetical protein